MFTALIIAALIVAGTATAVGGGLVLAARKRNALPGGGSPKQLTAGQSEDVLERGFGDLRVNDIVQYSGRDFLVEGVIDYDEAGHRWSMAYLVDGKEVHWLLVGLERTGAASKKLLRHTSEVELNGYPPEALVVGEIRYSFDKRGTATTSLTGNTGSLGGGDSGAARAHRCRWWNYQAPGAKALLVEQWGDDYRVLIGDTVTDSEVEMMPGS